MFEKRGGAERKKGGKDGNEMFGKCAGKGGGPETGIWIGNFR